MSRSRRLILAVLVVGVVGALITWGLLQPPPPTVVLISIDTLRPERLGVYGNGPDVSPHIDALAGEGVVFEQALALSPWTLPSHMTMLTGLDPVAHGVRRDDYRLSGRVVTLAEALKAAGFRTAAFTDGGFVSQRYGFGQGFEIYRDTMDTKGGPNGFRRLLPEALDFLRRTRHEPSFVFLHTFDVHTPYDEGDPEVLEQFRDRPVHDGPHDWQMNRLKYVYQQNQQRVTRYGRMEELLNDYDAGVHEADRGVGQVLDVLRETGRLDNALIIVTSDHGEAFAERGVHVGHGLALTDDELRVPLVVRLPQREAAGWRLDTQVDLMDLMPTMLEAMGVATPAAVQGESLLGLLRGKARRRDYSMGESQNTATAFLVANGFKYISLPSLDFVEVAKRHLGPMNPPATGGDPGVEYQLGHDSGILLRYDFTGDPLGVGDVLPQVPQLYDRAQDPLELHNLWEQDAPRSQLMAGKLAELIEASMKIHADLDDGQVAEPHDPHIQQQLAQLGYVAIGPEGGSNLQDLPRWVRDSFAHPYQPPDSTTLVAADRVAHTTRLRLQEGQTLSEPARARLQKLGDDYLAWLSENPGFTARVLWRLEALVALGNLAGLPLNIERWRQHAFEIGTRQEPRGDEGLHNPPPDTGSPPPTGGETPR